MRFLLILVYLVGPADERTETFWFAELAGCEASLDSYMTSALDSGVYVVLGVCSPVLFGGM